MTIAKLARMIVDEYFDGFPGSEHALIAVEQEEKKLRDSLIWDSHGNHVVQIRVEDDI